MDFLRKLNVVTRDYFAPTEANVVMRNGVRMSLYPRSDELERKMYIYREYEPATLGLFEKILRSGDNVIDVGANLGLMTLQAAKLVGTQGSVISIEPHPIYFRRLVEHIKLNDFSNVIAKQVAAGATVEDRPIYVVPSVNIGRASLINPGASGRQDAHVSVRTLDSIWEESALTPAIRLLKIDVEGFEFSVLQGADRVLAQRPIICMEFEVNMPTGGWDPFASHDRIVSKGQYGCYKFLKSKFENSPIVEIKSREDMMSLRNDNLIYIPAELVNELPQTLFAAS